MRILLKLRAFFFSVSVATVSAGALAIPTEITLVPMQRLVFGTHLLAQGKIHSPQDCSFLPAGARIGTGDILASIDGVAVPPPYVYRFLPGECRNGVLSQVFYIAANVPIPYYDMGPHIVAAQFLGRSDLGFEPSAAQLVVTIAPEFIREAPGGLGPIGIGISDPRLAYQYRDASSTVVTVTAAPDSATRVPAHLRFPYGFVNLNSRHFIECGFLCPPLGEMRTEEFMQLQMPGPLPPGSSVWAYLPHAGAPSPEWQQLEARIDERMVTVRLRGGYIASATQVRDAVLRGSVGVAVPQTVSAEQDLQDMWWGGASEDGWGISIQQRADALFATMQVYDGDGTPMWLMLPAGAWDPARTSFSGGLYRPASPRSLGTSVGTASFTFLDSATAILSYSIHGARGTKSLQRMPFPPATRSVASRAGVWDLTEAGSGGLTVNQRGSTLFATWLTFSPSGPGGWMVMPGGEWLDADTFEGSLYRTSGAPWAGTTYDSSRLMVAKVGQVRLRFTSPNTAEMSYTVDGVSGSSLLARHPF